VISHPIKRKFLAWLAASSAWCQHS
jgi:hypothetical protein